MIPVSIIIPCYRSAGVIERALNSVARQTARPQEILLVDDGNDDAFRAVIQAFSGRHPELPITLIRNPKNLGPSASRNRAWDQARGRFIAFLDHDDAWHPRKLEWQYRRITDADSPDFCSHASMCVEAGAIPPDCSEAWTEKTITPSNLVWGNFFSTPTVMIDRLRTERFDPRMIYAEDYDLWLRLVFNGARGVFLSAPLTYLFKARYGEGGLSSRLWSMEKGIQRVFQKLRRAGHLTSAREILLRSFSALKFCRRLLICRLAPRQSR